MKSFLFNVLFFISVVNTTYSQLFSEEPIVRVRIIYTLDTLKISFSNIWKLIDSSLSKEIILTPDDTLLCTIKNNQIRIKYFSRNINDLLTRIDLNCTSKNGTLKISNVPYGIGWWWQGSEDRIYEGKIEISVNENSKFDVIVALPLEMYLCGVVPYEIGNDAPIEALKAQVIAARSETVSALLSGKYKGSNFDLCADVECQVFAGNNKRTEITDKAVEETKGLCLFYEDKIIGAYYASNCGGISENVENVWSQRSGAVPYWSSHFDSDNDLNYKPQENPEEWIDSNPDVFCNPNLHPELPEWSKKNFRWEVEMTGDQLTNNLNELKHIGTIKEIIPLERGNSGRIIKARFLGTEDSLELNSELEIRKICKPPLRSSCFVVNKIVIDENVEKFLFKGAGWGHGVGMCQSGAIGRANAEQKFNEILIHYFPFTEIKNVFKDN